MVGAELKQSRFRRLQIYIRVRYYPATKLVMKLIRCFRSRTLFKLIAAISALVCVSVLARAQSPSNAQPKTPAGWLARAADLSDIRAAGSAPFTLAGQVLIPDGKGGNAQGTYRLDWNSPHEWREEITLPDFTRIKFGGEEKFWEKSSRDAAPIAVDLLDKLLNLVEVLRSQDLWVAGDVQEHASKRGQVKCVDMKWKSSGNPSHEFCFDPANGGLEEELWPSLATAGVFGQIETASVYSGFAEWGGKLFPREFSAWRGKDKIVEFNLEELDALQPGDAGRFSAPPGTEVWVACDKPEPAKLIANPGPIYPPPGFQWGPGGVAVVYGVIELDGHLSSLTVVQSAIPGLGESGKSAMALWKIQPPSCHRTPYRQPVYVPFYHF